MQTLRVLVLSLFVVSSASAGPQPPPVVGGTKAKHGDWPDVVAVIGEQGSCSGTLIAPDVVLTAGHCIYIEPKFVIANTVDFAQVIGPGQRIPVKWSRAYPNWEDRYDIGVIMLDHVATWRPRAIATACLANKLLSELRPVTVVGFGLTSPTGTDDNTELHQAVVPVLDPLCGSDPSCNPDARPNGEFTAGGRGTDSCMGDSGGPAMIKTPSGPALVGVVSRGLALPGLPCGNGGVYVRADKVVSWIESVTGRDLERVACDRPADDPEAEPEEAGGGCSAGG
ncbi:MAG: serine protease, partial [Deltaproteobacteria bacterium]|nr:serine protease [Deltaproteobacteria bacterium]